MWVLSTARAELHYFADCAAVPGGYAILSHTWTQDSAGEETFQDVQKVMEQHKKTDENPRDHVGMKIRRCCQIAEDDGYDWVWIDSCCINKESSTELSEAINSMFNWYALAEVCYVYLEDVPHDSDPRVWVTSFSRARWHSRGWTLQELLAPAFVIFFSLEWEKIGTKYDLRVPLSKCTGIKIEYLTRLWDFRVDASIARRMSWAAKRKTTRVEDEAYCLLGLFDINMPTLYGEGEHAFQRLQAELVKQSTDATLFCWGPRHYSSDGVEEQASLSLIHQEFHDPDIPDIFLFAPSPSKFIEWTETYKSRSSLSFPGQPTPPNSPLEEKGSPLSQAPHEIFSFEVTSNGMKCRFPVAHVDGITLAILPCRHRREHVGLLLHPGPNDRTQGPSRQLYYVWWVFCKPRSSPWRLACLGSDIHNLRFRGKPVTATWQDIYIAARPPTTGRTDGAHILQHFLPDVAPTTLRVPRTLMQTLGALRFFPTTKPVFWDPTSRDIVSICCVNTELAESVRILLGRCKKTSKVRERPRCWAWADQQHSETWNQTQWLEYQHDCTTDHIEDWPNRTREFGDAERMIRLVFASCKHDPVKTLVLGLELVGSKYELVQMGTKINLLPRACSGRTNAAASGQGSIGNLRGSAPPSASSLSRGSLSILDNPPTASRIDHLQITARSSETKSVNSIAEDLCDMSMLDAYITGHDGTHEETISKAEVSASVADAIRSLRQEFHETLNAHSAARDRELRETLREHDAAHDCKLHEIEEAHDTETRELIQIIESTRAEIAQLRGAPDAPHAPFAENRLARSVAFPA